MIGVGVIAIAALMIATSQPVADEVALTAAPEPSAAQVAAAVAASPSAAAPVVAPSPAPSVVSVPVPAPPSAPFVQTSGQAVSNFPSLPPSRPCIAQDITGLWQLKNVYENPISAETAAFSAYPFQYLFFDRDNIYRDHKSPYQDLSDTALAQQLKNQDSGALQQFVVGEGGAIFFYRDGVAVDTQVCFIVANQRQGFDVGQMLLMPPEGTSAVRIVKVYEQVVKKRPGGQRDQAKKKRGGKKNKNRRQKQK